jgi:hypothetical protein
MKVKYIVLSREDLENYNLYIKRNIEYVEAKIKQDKRNSKINMILKSVD